jgi:hypothetical protein
MRNSVLIMLTATGALAVTACSAAKPDPAPQLALQPILYQDITQNKLYGSGCNFVASDGGMGAVFLAQDKRGLIKLDGHIAEIPVATDAAALPQGAHTHYSSPLFSATLTKVPGGKHKAMAVVEVSSARLVITDAKRQPVYDATGDMQCKPM